MCQPTAAERQGDDRRSPKPARSQTRDGEQEPCLNNIGRYEHEDFFDITDERWHDYFEANLMTGIRITQPVLREMFVRDSGAIAFVASEAATRSLPQMVHDSTTKTALLGLSRALVETTRGTNVRSIS